MCVSNSLNAPIAACTLPETTEKNPLDNVVNNNKKEKKKRHLLLKLGRKNIDSYIRIFTFKVREKKTFNKWLVHGKVV